jgi:hypothetical protein
MGGSYPWPQVPVGNKDHTDAAVVIIGAGISGKSVELLRLESLLTLMKECAWPLT